MWENSRNYQKAIDRYLEITTSHFQNADHLEEIWMNAFNIAMTYAKDRIQEVVSVVGSRLLNIGKFEAAGEILESVGYYEKAVEAYVQAKKWDRAITCAKQVRPMELSNMLIDDIERKRKAGYIEEGKYDRIGGQGLEMLAQRGQWEECLNLAEKQGADTLNEYLMKFSRIYIK
jgi:intraflagellar transport protein 172